MYAMCRLTVDAWALSSYLLTYLPTTEKARYNQWPRTYTYIHQYLPIKTPLTMNFAMVADHEVLHYFEPNFGSTFRQPH